MPAFDWQRFLDSNSIAYVTSGKNVRTGEINIPCPFCRNDPSQHLGMNLKTGAWACWRDDAHVGRSPVRLIRALLQCSWEQAREVGGQGAGAILTPVDALEKAFQELGPARPRARGLEPLGWPRDIVRIDASRRVHRRFTSYLTDRGFDEGEVGDVIDHYGLRCALQGDMAYRLVFPVRMHGDLVAWYGRDVTGRSDLRYRAHPSGEASVGPEILLNYDAAAEGGRVLVVAEGPLDMAKLDWYGEPYGVRAVGLLGLFLSSEKVRLLSTLTYRFDRTVLVLDRGAERQALRFESRLRVLGVERADLPVGVEDPGELWPAAASRFARQLRDAEETPGGFL